MELLRAVFKELIPGSLLFFNVGLALGLVFLFGPPRSFRLGRYWLLTLLILYVALSLQGTSDLLVFGLTRQFHPVRTIDDTAAADLVVVLSDGIEPRRTDDQDLSAPNVQTSYNALEAARVFRLLGNPLVIASGGHSLQAGNDEAIESRVLASALEQLGIPAARIVEESVSRSTREQAVNVGRLIGVDRPGRFVLITAPEHMRRAVGAFTAVGLRPIPSPSSIQYGGRPFWRPTGYALAGSKSAIYEYLALGFYWSRRWL